jgi:hypothetical protein
LIDGALLCYYKKNKKGALMLIINPIIAETNIDAEIGYEPSYIRLMDYKFNDTLNKSLPPHRISFKLKMYDIEYGFKAGSVLFVEHNGISVVCIGVSPSFKDGVSESVLSIINSNCDDCIYYAEEADEIPGSEHIKSALESAEKQKVSIVSWEDIKVKLKELRKDKL